MAKQCLCKHRLESLSRLLPRSEPTAWLASALEVKRDAARELAETASCKNEDAGEASDRFLNHEVYVEKFILALDQGTTSSRAMLTSMQDGSVKAVSQKPFRQDLPIRRGWVEHDPKEIWSSQAAVAAEVMAAAGIKSQQIAAIGITNQRETTLLWERKSGNPLMNAIVWQDRRTTELCQKLKSQGFENAIQQKTGLLLDPYFSASKIHWMLRKNSWR